jgi:hypothetical protein
LPCVYSSATCFGPNGQSSGVGKMILSPVSHVRAYVLSIAQKVGHFVSTPCTLQK